MIRAIVRNGTIEPLSPLPAGWEDGRELVVEEANETPVSQKDVEAWAQEVEAAMAEIPGDDYDRFEAALAEHERESKELVRRQWNLE